MSYRRAVPAFVRKELQEIRSQPLAAAGYVLLPLALALTPAALGAAGLPAGSALSTALAPSLIAGLTAFTLVSLTASQAIAGERAERTLEPLLAAPLTDAEILIGKLLGLALPALAASLGAAGVATLAAAAIGRAWPAREALLVLAAAPLAALLGALLSISIAARGTSLRAAERLATLVALPAGATLLLALRVLVPGFVGLAALAGLDFLLLLYALARFHRERLLSAWR